MARKKWRVVSPVDQLLVFRSRVQADNFVDLLRGKWAAGVQGAAGSVTVQVDEGTGYGWETYEHIDFAEEAA